MGSRFKTVREDVVHSGRSGASGHAWECAQRCERVGLELARIADLTETRHFGLVLDMKRYKSKGYD